MLDAYGLMRRGLPVDESEGRAWGCYGTVLALVDRTHTLALGRSIPGNRCQPGHNDDGERMSQPRHGLLLSTVIVRRFALWDQVLPKTPGRT